MDIPEYLWVVSEAPRHKREFARMGGSLFVEKAPADKVIFLERGWVALIRITPEGTLSFIEMIMPGDIYVEHRDAHQWNGVVIGGGATYKWELKSSFMERVSGDPAAMQEYVSSVVSQQQRSRELTDVRNGTSVMSRLAALLVWMISEMRSTDTRHVGLVAVKFPFQHADVAMILHTRREAIAKTMGVLRRRGIIGKPNRGVLNILDEDLLRRLVLRGQRALV